MGAPTPVTPPDKDLGIRTHTAYDLEKTLVVFLTQLLGSYRLDNPQLNTAQGTAPTHPIVTDPDDVVPFDPTLRAQTLKLKVAPQVVRGRVPRTVTGEINVDKLPDFPSVIVQAIKAKVETDSTLVTVCLYVNAYDENPDGSGYQDVLNLTETIALALTSYGQGAIDAAYPIVLPLTWELVLPDTFPHFISEMTTVWELPSARPLPDAETFGIVPGEHLDLRVEEDPAYRQ
jgi:hypothetical protein